MITMKSRKRRMALAAVVAGACIVSVGIGAFTSKGSAQARSPFAYSGTIGDFTPALDANGPWQVSGVWNLDFRGDSGLGDFTVDLNMARFANTAPSHHTHHIRITNPVITALDTGFRVSGEAVITGGNGAVAPSFSGSTVTADITGGSVVALSDIAITVDGGAASHFGAPLNGVVNQR